MQACIYREYGPAEVVRISEVDTPQIRADEVLVRVQATSVTSADYRFRASAFPPIFWLPGRLMTGLFRPRNPVLGMDFSGVVQAVGGHVTRFRVGDAVFGAASAMGRGAHAEYVAVRESGVILHKPAFLTDVEAAAIPFGANSALAFLRDFGRVQPGQRVLVVGATGGVGSWAVQLARHFGAEVTAVSSARNLDLARSLGAHHALDYAQEDYLRNGKTYELIFDTVGMTTFVRAREALSAHGTYLPLNSGFTEIVQALRTRWAAGKRVKSGVSANTRAGLECIVGLIEAGVLKPVIDRVYPMDHIVAAHHHVQSRHKRGSVIVTMGRQAAK